MTNRSRPAPSTASVALAEVQIQLLATPHTKARARRLLAKHHYLGDVRAVGEQLFYAVTDGHDGWLGVLVFCAASRRLRARDRWIGWSEEQRRRRLPLLVNNCRFLLLPHKTFPNLGSRTLRLTLDRLSADWQARYGQPVVLVETFVDPEQFCGTVYTAQGWQELGTTDGFGRGHRDFYVQHHPPKRLFARALCPNARRSLQAEKLKPALAGVEAKTRPRRHRKPRANPLAGRTPQAPARLPRAHRHLSPMDFGRHRRAGPSVRRAARTERLGQVCPRPQPGPALRPGRAPASRRPISRPQPADLLPPHERHRRRRIGKDFPANPGANPRPRSARRTHRAGRQTTEARWRPLHAHGRDGAQPALPGQRESGHQDQRNPRRPRALKKLDLDGRKVSLDALHTQDQTARELVLEHGADYLFTAKDNQPTLRASIERLVPAPPADFSPSAGHADAGGHA